VARFVLAAVSQYLAGTAALAMLAALRTRIFAHVQALSVRYFDRAKAGRIVARMDRDVDALEPLVIQGPPELLGALLRCVVSSVLLFGLLKLVETRHPRALARVPPSQLAWWSFLMATAHGAGLMLVPFMLGLCETPQAEAPAIDQAHGRVMDTLARSDVGTALAVAGVHTLAMLLAGMAMAFAVYRWLGLQFLRKAWLNLDRVWGASLLLAGAAGVWMAI
jgi:ABC-type multidrug transport system fused ATPase/permease subunit